MYFLKFRNIFCFFQKFSTWIKWSEFQIYFVQIKAIQNYYFSSWLHFFIFIYSLDCLKTFIFTCNRFNKQCNKNTWVFIHLSSKDLLVVPIMFCCFQQTYPCQDHNLHPLSMSNSQLFLALITTHFLVQSNNL